MSGSVASVAMRGLRGVTFVCAAAFASPGGATTFVVDTPVDLPDGNILDGICSYLQQPDPNVPTCSLRAAVTQANAIPLADMPAAITILLSASETYFVGGDNDAEVSGRVGDLDISRPMVIGVPAGETRPLVRRTQGNDRLFDIHAGAAGTVLRGMRLKSSQDINQGCIVRTAKNAGALRIERSKIFDSSCSAFGAVSLFNSPTTIADTEFHHGGRAVWASGAVVNVERSTFRDHSGVHAFVLTEGSTGTITYSTFSHNSNAITTRRSNLFVIGSTFTGGTNEHITVRSDLPGITLRINNSVFSSAGNRSCAYTREDNTPVASAGEIGAIVDVSGSIFDDNTCIPNNNAPATPNLHDAVILLSPLGNHGGDTSTHMLLPGSDGIDWIAPQQCQSNGKDQRGLPRAISYSGLEPAHCDAGSTELQLVAPPPEGQIFGDGFEG